MGTRLLWGSEVQTVLAARSASSLNGRLECARTLRKVTGRRRRCRSCAMAVRVDRLPSYRRARSWVHSLNAWMTVMAAGESVQMVRRTGSGRARSASRIAQSSALGEEGVCRVGDGRRRWPGAGPPCGRGARRRPTRPCAPTRGVQGAVRPRLHLGQGGPEPGPQLGVIAQLEEQGDSWGVRELSEPNFGSQERQKVPGREERGGVKERKREGEGRHVDQSTRSGHSREGRG